MLARYRQVRTLHFIEFSTQHFSGSVSCTSLGLDSLLRRPRILCTFPKGESAKGRHLSLIEIGEAGGYLLLGAVQG